MIILKIAIVITQILGCFKPLRFGLGVKITKWLIKHDSIGFCYDLCILVPFRERQKCIDLIVDYEARRHLEKLVRAENSQYLKCSDHPRLVEHKIMCLDKSPQRSFWKNHRFIQFTSLEETGQWA